MLKRAELTPLTELGAAHTLELPDYVPAERIGVNTALLGKMATTICCRPDVSLEMYTGSTTKYDPGIVGMQQDTGMAGMNASKDQAPLARHVFRDYDPANGIPTDKESIIVNMIVHQRPALGLQFNMAEIDTRLQDGITLRDPEPWVKVLNAALSEGIQGAGREHLLRSGIRTKSEVLTGTFTAGAAMMLMAAGLMIVFDDTSTEAAISMIPAYVGSQLLLFKWWKKRCLS